MEGSYSFKLQLEALSLKEVPKHMIVIGGGVIGLELGSVYGRHTKMTPTTSRNTANINILGYWPNHLDESFTILCF